MSGAQGTGHGKVLLCGEHAVVHGHPAIALAVDRKTRITLRRTGGPTRIESAHGDPRLLDALGPLLPPTGLHLTVATDLPVGRGMGSSAALAVALTRARARLGSKHLTPQQIYDVAMPIERAFHGNPSGVDVAVSTWGGCLWFQPGDPPERVALQMGRWRLVVLDSGQSGDTRRLVAHVATLQADDTLARIGALVHKARAALLDATVLGPLLTENHRLLTSLGVSTPELDGLVTLALDAGAHGAKLSGAGGGGIVIAVVDDPAPVLAAARAAGVTAFGCVPWSP